MIMGKKEELRKIQYEIWELEDKQNKIYVENERLRCLNDDKIEENNNIYYKLEDNIVKLKEKIKSLKSED